uniref:Secreted protein n=1 Tax=Haemonchus contortus TaxID=6289 RepID=A0A7I4Y7A6_HAECO
MAVARVVLTASARDLALSTTVRHRRRSTHASDGRTDGRSDESLRVIARLHEYVCMCMCMCVLCNDQLGYARQCVHHMPTHRPTIKSVNRLLLILKIMDH